MIRRAQESGFQATVDYGEIAQMDVVIMCAPTPLDEYHEPDLSFIRDTVRSIAPHIHDGQLIILESTTYPGTTEEVVVPLLEQGNQADLRMVGTPGALGWKRMQERSRAEANAGILVHSLKAKREFRLSEKPLGSR
jgi:UDP-N-acetyl-D-glucosamine dehydrogenase